MTSTVKRVIFAEALEKGMVIERECDLRHGEGSYKEHTHQWQVIDLRRDDSLTSIIAVDENGNQLGHGFTNIFTLTIFIAP